MALLFLLTGILGAFASGAATAAIDSRATAAHCLDAGADDGGDDFGLGCCTLGCAMVTAALPAPSAGTISVPRAPFGTGRTLGSFVVPPAILAAGESPRGPPIA
jgi:hypothetical protein